MTTYTYSILSDILVGDINPALLEEEIQESVITIALDSITTHGDVLEVVFKAELSVSERSTLDQIVLSHEAGPSPSDPAVVDILGPKDTTGRLIIRAAASREGWTAQFHSICFKTSTIGGYCNKGLDGSDLGFVSVKIFDASGVEITDPALEGEAVTSEVYWMPNYDYEIISGQLLQAIPPSVDVFLWVVGLPGILDIPFSQGGVNLKLSGNGGSVKLDGRAAKFLPYNGGAGTNRFKLILRHPAGVKHEAQILFEIFKE